MLAEREFSSVMTNGAAPGDFPALDAADEALVLEAPYAPGNPAHHRQSQQQLAQLDAVAGMLAGLANAEPPFRDAMTGAGLIEGYLAECNARLVAAETAVEVRRQAMLAALAATESLNAANFQAHAAYSGFRQVARTVVQSPSGRAALKLDERVPTSRALFVRAAQAALTAAQDEPYALQLQQATFGPERVAATLEMVDALTAAATVQIAAQHRARLATEVRDAAMRDLRKVARQITVEVKTLLRRNPQLRAPVGFAR